MTDYNLKYIKYKTKYYNIKYQMDNNIEGGGGDKKTKSASNQYKEIYFIRHGETDWNLQNRTQGQEADIPLNETGKEQAIKTGKYLHKFRIRGNKNPQQFDCVLSSPMSRCVETTNLICDKIKFTKSNIEFDADIMEVKKGNMSGLTSKDKLMEDFGLSISKYLDKIKDPIEKISKTSDPELASNFYENIIEYNDLGIVGVESSNELISRTKRFIEKIKTTRCKKILVITHSGFLEVLLKLMFELNVLPKGNLSNGKNCCISYCLYNGIDDKFKMITPLNTEHLGLDI